MRKLTVLENVTLDGVMQSPAKPDEDTRGGFTRGGWGVAGGADPAIMAELSKGFGTGEMLLGRFTYEDYFAFWPKQADGNPFTELLNRATKYVVSNTLADPLPWENSILLSGDAVEAVRRLREQDGPDLGVQGSGVLVRSLLAAGLVDRLDLIVHPIVLGEGTRLFPESGPDVRLDLQHAIAGPTGVVLASYAVGR